ncbi:MAG: DNA primase [Candidatus Saccharibacteria bacterium]
MDARDEVKSRLAIEDVIGRYVELKKAGRNFKALSPFSKEKTASFIVSPEKQIWHDFSSGKGGDVFSFVMEVEGLDFREALELLARRAGVDIEQYESKGRSGVSKTRLYEIYELATKFYQVQFSANRQAYDYVMKKRGFSKQTALTWQIGYSPNTGDALYTYIKGKGYSDKEIQTSGLVTERYSKLNDMFRGRLMIPLADSQGRVIGFTARLLDDNDNGPKYINSPQSVLYDKSRHIFGLHLAKEAIRENGYVVVVEGNLDVIASNQAGVKQVVATAGTALTEQHLKGLGLLTKDIRFCFDADKAGLAATERAIPLASKQNLNVSVITIPNGKDPDELISTDKQAWLRVIEEPKYAIDWLIEHYVSQVDLKSAPGKRRLSDLVLPIVQSLSDAVERDHYINQLSKLLEVSPSALSSKLNNLKGDAPKAKLPIRHEAKPLDKDEVERLKTQDNFLSLILVHKSLRKQASLLSSEMLISDNGRKLFEILGHNPDLDLKKDVAVFKELTDYVKIEVLLYEELYSGLGVGELKYEATRLKARLVESYIKTQKAILTKQLQSSDSVVTRELLEKAKILDNLLNQVKGEGSLNAQEATT